MALPVHCRVNPGLGLYRVPVRIAALTEKSGTATPKMAIPPLTNEQKTKLSPEVGPARPGQRDYGRDPA